jgi:hypothetical protein
MLYLTWKVGFLYYFTVSNIFTDNLKPVADEQVFYDKFLCDKFYLPSARVYMQQILNDKFSYDKFYLLVWTCQQVYFDNLLVASNVMVQRTTRALPNRIKCSDYFDKFSLLTHTILNDKFSYDKFYLLVWTCQQVYFDNVMVQRTTRALANRIKCSDYFDKFSLLTHTDEQNLDFFLWQVHLFKS